jgi:hypothetical protein
MNPNGWSCIMSALEDAFKGGNIVTGVGLAIGALVVAPLIIPILRPVAKSLVKAGVVAYEQGRVAFAELGEQTSDLLAEARSELAEAGRETERAPAAEPAAHHGTS